MTNDEAYQYLLQLREDEIRFKNPDGLAPEETLRPPRSVGAIFKRIAFVARSLMDLLLLVFRLRWRSLAKGKRVVFTARNLCSENNGVLEDRIVKPLFTKDIVFINHSKQYYLDEINSTRVYNVGGVVKLLSVWFFRGKPRLMRISLSYRIVNDLIISHLSGQEVYTLCFYDHNGLSLAFSKARERMILCEVQHGSIINYPPYVKPAPIKIADVFYVKNQATVSYLKSHLCRNNDPEYRLIPYPKADREHVPGLHLFYASTVEVGGLHPILRTYLAAQKSEDLDVIVRLHPREQDKEDVFRQQLSECDVAYKFDRSKNWLESNKIANLVVISPWSSTIEDAYDNGFLTIIIDPVGRERYRHLLDRAKCFYSEDLKTTLATIREKVTC